MNYAFLDVAQEFHLEIISKFLNETNSTVSFMNTAVLESFHGNFKQYKYYISKLKESNPDLILKDLNDFLYLDTYNVYQKCQEWSLHYQEFLQ